VCYKKQLKNSIPVGWAYKTLSFCLSFIVYIDADMEDYGFEYSLEEQEEQYFDIENQHYNSRGAVSLTYI